MKSVICKQDRALKGKILSALILCFAIFYAFQNTEPLVSRVLFSAGSLLLFGFSVSYKITENFQNRKLYSIFGVVIFSSKLELDFPDYISVFSGSFSMDNEWGAVSAIGTKERHEKLVVRFFTGNKYVSLFKTENYKEALQKAEELSKLLEVEIYDTTKE
ncbi:hypothetical protein [Aquimarina spongiae]|uniref:Uncharacterized protein n=1 Tax=Aquimarina spongiae TaxID=570521 RepID=A0A1M6FC59_9FLAO|nr:hypothetical protein [Aquimarina spongiae]SHI95255.1 hypothetical protein SAMN04488508_104203 [Aquimarina spongiae]